MNRDELFAELEKKSDLPTLPAVMNRLTEVVNQPDTDAQQVANIIKDDPAMTARVLKVVNSTAYSTEGNITSIQQAVARMGLTSIKNIALSTSVFSTFDSNSNNGFDQQEFWRHSVCVGIGANVLYERTREMSNANIPRDVLHLSGLLHDIGKILFASHFHSEFIQATQAAATGRPLFEAERETLGADHAEIGAWLAERWNLSPEIIETVRWHHDPEQGAEKYLDLLRLSHTANHICNLEQIGNSGDQTSPAFNIGVWKRLGLKVRDIREIVKEVIEESKMSETLMAFN